MTGYANIADFEIEVQCDFEFSLFDFSNKNNHEADMSISIEMEDVYNYRKLMQTNTSKFSCAFQITLEKIAKKLPEHNSFLLHSATFEVDGQGIAFSAKSGTGKTTHMINWQKLLGDKITIINGDKPIVRFFDDEPENPYAYGTPWNGKERFGNDSCTPLKHICFIERDEKNFVTSLDKSDAINRIMKQVYIPDDPIALELTLSLVDRLISCCKLWVIHCNMEPESAEIAYKTIFGNK